MDRTLVRCNLYYIPILGFTDSVSALTLLACWFDLCCAMSCIEA
jgi:hypothetical protein